MTPLIRSLRSCTSLLVYKYKSYGFQLHLFSAAVAHSSNSYSMRNIPLLNSVKVFFFPQLESNAVSVLRITCGPRLTPHVIIAAKLESFVVVFGVKLSLIVEGGLVTFFISVKMKNNIIF